MSSRVGIVSYAANRPMMGITRYTQEMISALRAHGVPVTVLHAGHIPARDGLVGLRGAGRVPGLLTVGQAEIAWNASRHDLALVHDPTGLAPLAGTRVKRISTIHDAIPYIYPEASSALNRLVARHWLPRISRSLDAIITDSEASRADLVHYLCVEPEQVHAIPLGVDRDYRPIDSTESREVLARYGITFPYILYVGAVEFRNSRKNLLRLLEAYAQLPDWMSNQWRLVIAGAVRKDYRPVFDVVEQLRLEPYVHFTGYVEDTDLPAVYSGADLFVLPSLYEGFGLPVLEAMACGSPVVTSNVSSLPEVAGDAAVLVDPYSVEAIANAICRVLSDADLATDLRTKGLKRAQLFSWERTASETIAIYRQVLGNPIP